MKGFRGIPRVLKINSLESYRASLLFNNGESRIIDFERLFREVFKLRKGRVGFELLEDHAAFEQMTLMNNSIGWEGIGTIGKDITGKEVFYPYDLDPMILYKNSEPDKERIIEIGLMIKYARKEMGLTQEELALKSGTTKYYISRIENNRSDIELMTLKKIVEAGLGKTLEIRIR